MGCTPGELGAKFTAEEFYQLLALWAGGDLSGL
jgi:hypothetical protein